MNSVEVLKEIFYPKSVSATQTSTNSYVDVTGSKIDTYSKSKVCYTILNNDLANSLNWKVLCSNDDSTYVEAQAEATITTGNSGSYTNTLATYRYYKVQIKSTVGGSHAEAEVNGYSKC